MPAATQPPRAASGDRSSPSATLPAPSAISSGCTEGFSQLLSSPRLSGDPSELRRGAVSSPGEHFHQLIAITGR